MKAQSVLANPNATQDEVNAAKEALQTAYDGLVKDTTLIPNPNPNRSETAVVRKQRKQWKQWKQWK